MTVDEIKAKMRTTLLAADAIAKKAEAENRDMNREEVAAAGAHLRTYEGLKGDLDRAKQAGDSDRFAAGAAQVKAALDAIGAELNGDFGSGKSFLNLKSPRLAEGIQREMSGDGQKAVITAGSTITTAPVDPDPVLLGRAPQTLLDVIPVVKRNTPGYRYVRETVRTNNAAPVAVGALKPTSIFTVGPVDARLKVIAHLSEGIDKYLLADATNLRQFIAAEMTGGLREAISSQIISGDGTGDNFTGFNTVAGTQAVAGTPTDLLTSIRGAITLLQNIGLTPSFTAMAPGNWQVLETKRNTSGNFDFGSPSNLADRQVYGTDIVPVVGLDLKKVYVVADGAVQLSSDGAILTEWFEDATTASRNQIIARTEGRFNSDVLNPAGIVIITFASNPS